MNTYVIYDSVTNSYIEAESLQHAKRLRTYLESNDPIGKYEIKKFDYTLDL